MKKRMAAFFCVLTMVFAAGCKNVPLGTASDTYSEKQSDISSQSNSGTEETDINTNDNSSANPVASQSASSEKTNSKTEDKQTTGGTSEKSNNTLSKTNQQTPKSQSSKSTTTSSKTTSKKPSSTSSAASGMTTIPLPNGGEITVKEGTNLLEYTLDMAKKTASAGYTEIEKAIFDATNAERKKAGIKTLAQYPKGYYYTKKRAQEISTVFTHDRPNGMPWYTVYTDADILIDRDVGENLAKIEINDDTPSKIAEIVVDGWMKSKEHRENILEPCYDYMCIAVVKVNGWYYIAQGFYAK